MEGGGGGGGGVLFSFSFIPPVVLLKAEPGLRPITEGPFGLHVNTNL